MTYEEALDLLPVRYAQALHLRRLGCDEQAIAAELAVEPAAVGPMLQLAEAKLARLLAEPAEVAPSEGRGLQSPPEV
ncbi:hypothetical protein DLE60_16370 [Micromonospora globispora]|uniref:RNA polymerase sigma factor 70 region 4 type 2 domain-containing protein n=1 Tax=Micromonospora globispora TaxID=1450148 RepID=A0A317JSB8_9ACTN|nr:sigma-70 family RNA polymerase sigma factor [Micromonospora globispora]PWU43475.1 hypothetical protein DLJ46_31475 [Micromonospora globispora]PWU59479.1 hypothetical protein DLE60_16370 [Micromonospora globispora]